MEAGEEGDPGTQAGITIVPVLDRDPYTTSMTVKEGIQRSPAIYAIRSTLLKTLFELTYRY
jgi:hypothetical protein